MLIYFALYIIVCRNVPYFKYCKSFVMYEVETWHANLVSGFITFMIFINDALSLNFLHNFREFSGHKHDTSI